MGIARVFSSLIRGLLFSRGADIISCFFGIEETPSFLFFLNNEKYGLQNSFEDGLDKAFRSLSPKSLSYFLLGTALVDSCRSLCIKEEWFTVETACQRSVVAYAVCSGCYAVAAALNSSDRVSIGEYKVNCAHYPAPQAFSVLSLAHCCNCRNR